VIQQSPEFDETKDWEGKKEQKCCDEAGPLEEVLLARVVSQHWTPSSGVSHLYLSTIVPTLRHPKLDFRKKKVQYLTAPPEH